MAGLGLVERLNVCRPAHRQTDTAGSAEDAFDVEIPSIPVGFSGKPTTKRWGPDRVAVPRSSG